MERRMENTLKSQWELEVKTSKPPKGQENAGDQVVIDCNFASDWSREWREFFGPIIEQSREKPVQSHITLETQLKVTLLMVFESLIWSMIVFL